MSTTQYVWFNDNPDFEKNFLEYLIGHHKINGDDPVSWNSTSSANSHMCATNSKKFPHLKKSAKHHHNLTQALEAIGVVVARPRNSYTWTVPDVSVRKRLETILSSAPKDWLEQAEELVEKYADTFKQVGIDLDRELSRVQGSGTTKTQTAATWIAWFRRNRMPALENSDWYLRGINREGKKRLRSPFSGYLPENSPEVTENSP